jgi:hypothetical protein
MLSKAHFEAMLECSWDHGMEMSEILANGDGTILFYCKIYNIATADGFADVDAEPYYSMRAFCIEKLKEYYNERY